jgi:hypothetical protein
MMANEVNGTERHWRKEEVWGRSERNGEGKDQKVLTESERQEILAAPGGVRREGKIH